MPASSGPDRPVELAQVIIEQRVIVRIPTVPQRGATRTSLSAPAAPPPPPPQMRWKEAKGPKCLALKLVRGAHIAPVGEVTMMLGRSELMRAHFDRSCRPTDFLSGFYIEPNKDGTICAGRDTLHARNGQACEIRKFSKLVAEPVDEEEDEER